MSGRRWLPPVLRGWPGLAAPRLVLALDYDGTLTPIVERPEHARPDAELKRRLGRLAALRGVTVVVVSGRGLATLGRWVAEPRLILIGSQGGEWRRGGRRRPLLAPPGLDDRMRAVARRLRRAAGSWPGVQLERKYASVAVHYRNVPRADRRRVLAAVRSALARECAAAPGLAVMPGKRVLEIRRRGVDKGIAFRRVVRLAGLSGQPVLAAGDDHTDEELFAVLGAGDLSIHVGRRRTRARRSTRSPTTLNRALEGLARYRENRHTAPGG